MILKNTKFLIIEDDYFFRDMLVDNLRTMDFKGPFLTAADGLEAIKIIQINHSSTIDFIICDIYMPNLDGLSFLTRLRDEELLDSPTPIMMLTSVMDRKIVVECMKRGASGYLLKPWNQLDLANKLVSTWQKIHNLD
jgi:CheY-like chemotaxis protein